MNIFLKRGHMNSLLSQGTSSRKKKYVNFHSIPIARKNSGKTMNIFFYENISRYRWNVEKNFGSFAV